MNDFENSEPAPRRALEEDGETQQGEATGASASDSGKSGSVLGALGRGVREVVLVVVLALVISAVVRAFVGQVFVIPSASMEDTIHVQDRVVAMKVVDAQRGDIIVFRDPGGWLDSTPSKPGPVRHALQFIGVVPDTSTNHLLKRLIGMPGDTVECCDAQGRLKVNGRAIDEPYLKDGLPAAAVPFKVVVPKDRVFVMGDNRNSSRDSRCHLSRITNDGQPQGMIAFVPIKNIVGPATYRVAPLDRLGQLSRPEVFAQVPASALSVPPDKPVIEPAGTNC